MVNLESSQAMWAKECCKGGNCPICNPPIEDEEDEVSDETQTDLYGDR